MPGCPVTSRLSLHLSFNRRQRPALLAIEGTLRVRSCSAARDVAGVRSAGAGAAGTAFAGISPRVRSRRRRSRGGAGAASRGPPSPMYSRSIRPRAQKRRERLEGPILGARSTSSTIRPAPNRSSSTATSKPVSPDLAPSPGWRPRPLGARIDPWRPGGEPMASCSWNSAGSSSGRRKNVRPVRPWRTPFMAERALPSAVTGRVERTPLWREASDWAGVGDIGMLQAPAVGPTAYGAGRPAVKEFTLMQGQPHLRVAHGRTSPACTVRARLSRSFCRPS